MFNLQKKISILENKDTSAAYKALLELEQKSEESDCLYAYIMEFVNMVSSEKYVIRVRGFRLFCKQARWDTENIINKNLESAMCILNDDKPTAVRQALSALSEVVKYKPELREQVRDTVSSINYLKYKDTMHSLIEKDIDKLLKEINHLTV